MRAAAPSIAAAQVRELLHKRIRDAYLHPQFQTDVMKPLSIEPLMDQQVRNGSQVRELQAPSTPLDTLRCIVFQPWMDARVALVAIFLQTDSLSTAPLTVNQPPPAALTWGQPLAKQAVPH